MWPRRCAILASSCCTVALCSRHPCWLLILALIPVPDPSSFLFFGGTVPCTPPCRANPIPFFLLFPTQARTGSAPWPTPSPPHEPSPVIPLYTASTFGALHHLLRSPAIRCHLACFSSIPAQIRSRAHSIDFLRQRLGRRSSESSREGVVGGRATRSSRCSQIYGR
jgi:hypothetical protein